jgi:hypothetical protein
MVTSLGYAVPQQAIFQSVLREEVVQLLKKPFRKQELAAKLELLLGNTPPDKI